MAERTAAFTFRLLGPLDVRRNGEQVPVDGPHLRALLAMLLLRANAPVSRDRLVDDLWQHEPPRHASNALQVLVSRLRGALAPDGAAMVVHSTVGYMLAVPRSKLDLLRVEDDWAAARAALCAGDPETASRRLSATLDVWRGDPLAEFAGRWFADADRHRLAEMRLAVQSDWFDAELALGHHHQVLGELAAVVAKHPNQERPLRQLMLALYRCGRQVDALAEYTTARRRLDDDFGLAPGSELQQLERAILQQDPSLDLPVAATPVASQPIILWSSSAEGLAPMAALAAPLATQASARELLLVRLLAGDEATQLSGAVATQAELVHRLRRSRIVARSAAFTSTSPGDDLVRLADEQSSVLVLLEFADQYGSLLDMHTTVLADCACDVGLLATREGKRPRAHAPVLVPFGGNDHDWTALELGCWIARASNAPLRLLGVSGRSDGARDASRTLSSASLATQRSYGIVAEPEIVSPGADGILGQADGARALVVGLSFRRGLPELGSVRETLLARSECPVVLVRRGRRPGGLAPARAVTRFTWSLSDDSDAHSR
ncbi:MAG TPA: BTAD domain-containing putative transcriptional regulator [Gaiellales bacterium]|nr:BTAD domain-containing putative transcriptional regulator [Gaiellales bacterium]